jgi:hypothetical protein
MNIGKWIVVAFVLFAAFITTLVVICVRQDVSLVSKNYYEEELAYQDQIQRINNTDALIHKPAITVVDHAVRIDFNPAGRRQDVVLTLFCPADEKMDRRFLITSEEPVQIFSLDETLRGMYRAKLQWKEDDKEYYLEEVIYM